MPQLFLIINNFYATRPPKKTTYHLEVGIILLHLMWFLFSQQAARVRNVRLIGVPVFIHVIGHGCVQQSSPASVQARLGQV
jgi:hypothetical protein